MTAATVAAARASTDSDFLRTEEACKALALGQNRFYDLVNRHKIPVLRTSPRRMAVPRRFIEALGRAVAANPGLEIDEIDPAEIMARYGG